MKSRMHGLLAAGTVCVLASTSALALDAASKCESSKLGTSAKYASCRLKADSKSAKTGDPVNYSNCDLSKFTSAETTAGMGECRTEGDETTVKDYLDTCTSRVALWLNDGGGLPDTCDSDLVACESDVSTTNADLTTCEGDLATCEALPQGKTQKTGQTTCYDTPGSVIACEGTFQDGETQNGLTRSFTDNGDGTITDNNSGLMWEKLSDDGSVHDKDLTLSWDYAVTYKLFDLITTNFAMHADWRVPTIAELETLKNFGAASPCVYSQFSTGCVPGCTVLTCSCTQSDFYWSSTTSQGTPSAAWIVNFLAGNTTTGFKTSGYRLRAVRTVS